MGGITFGSVYLGSYCSDEGFVERACFIEIDHCVGAGLAAQSSLVASDMSPF